MKLVRRNSSRRFVIPVAILSFLLVAESRSLAAPAADVDLPATQSGFTPRTVQEQIKLAGDYLIGRGVAQDLKLAAYWYEKAAGSGNPQAEMQIGYFYDAGIGVEKDPARAAHWYQLAAAGGLAGAKVNLGVLYLWGNGVEKNPQLAAKLLREAVKAGSGRAACFLGDIYYLGTGVPVDKAAGEKWYVRGTELHDPQAEYDLGLLLFVGKDHAHDLVKAEALLRESAAAGYVPAIHSLGLLLVRNPERARSADEAAKLLSESAGAGIWRSSMILGILTRDGKGVAANPGDAYYHFRVAALQGGDEASKLLESDLQRLAAQLGPGKTADLDAQAQSFFEHHRTTLDFVYKPGELRAGFPAFALAAPADGAHTVRVITSQPD
jgi:uncharacterized protein